MIGNNPRSDSYLEIREIASSMDANNGRRL